MRSHKCAEQSSPVAQSNLIQPARLSLALNRINSPSVISSPRLSISSPRITRSSILRPARLSNLLPHRSPTVFIAEGARKVINLYSFLCWSRQVAISIASSSDCRDLFRLQISCWCNPSSTTSADSGHAPPTDAGLRRVVAKSGSADVYCKYVYLWRVFL